MLSVHLFGGLKLTWGAEPLPTIQSRVARSLCAYLVFHHQHAHTRDLLIGLFWPEQSETVGHRRLSQALW